MQVNRRAENVMY